MVFLLALEILQNVQNRIHSRFGEEILGSCFIVIIRGEYLSGVLEIIPGDCLNRMSFVVLVFQAEGVAGVAIKNGILKHNSITIWNQ